MKKIMKFNFLKDKMMSDEIAKQKSIRKRIYKTTIKKIRIISDIKIKLNNISGDEIEMKKILTKRMRTTFDTKTKSN
jgi:hypothetical protein